MNKGVGEYTLSERLGKGSYAEVFKALHKPSREEFAIKVIERRKLTPKLQENLESEIKIMRDHHHPNIVQLFDILKTENHIYLVLEYCAGGDLQKFIQHHVRLTESVTRFFMRQLAEGLRFLSSRNLIHRDIKPQNLLLTKFATDAGIKIADFGFARHLAQADLAQTLCGTPLYMAPEIMQFRQYDAKADLWSVGAVLYEMLTGKPPFTGENQADLYRNIQTKPLRFPRDVNVSADCLSVLQQLLERKPSRRASLDQFCESRFISFSEEEKTEPRPPQLLLDGDRRRCADAMGEPEATGFEENKTSAEQQATTTSSPDERPAIARYPGLRQMDPGSNGGAQDTSAGSPLATYRQRNEPLDGLTPSSTDPSLAPSSAGSSTPSHVHMRVPSLSPSSITTMMIAGAGVSSLSQAQASSVQLSDAVTTTGAHLSNPGATSPQTTGALLPRINPFKPPETSPGASALRHSHAHSVTGKGTTLDYGVPASSGNTRDWIPGEGIGWGETGGQNDGDASTESDEYVIVEPSLHAWTQPLQTRNDTDNVKSVPQGASLDHYVPAASVNYRDEFTTVSQAEKFADLAVAVTSAGDASVRSSAATAPRRTASASQTSIHVGALQDALTLYLHGMSMLKEGIDKAVTMQSQLPGLASSHYMLVTQLIHELKQRFDGILDRAEKCKTRIESIAGECFPTTPQSTGARGSHPLPNWGAAFVSPRPAGALMYQHAMALARDAALEEMMGNKAARDMYERARLLVEGVLLTCKDAQDQKVLRSYAKKFEERIRLLSSNVDESKDSSGPDRSGRSST